MTAAAPSFSVERRSVSIIGGLLVVSVVLLFGSIFWLFSGQNLALLQIPLVLLSLMLVMMTGLLYIINPPKQMGAALLTVIYFTLDLTLRQGLVQGGGADAQSIVKGMIGIFLFGFGLFNGLQRVFRHPILGLFFIYAGYAAFSASYSSTMALAVGSGLTLLGIVFVVAKTATEDKTGVMRLWTYIYAAAALAAVLSLGLLAAVPNMARDFSDPGAFRLRGITGNANSLGPMMAVGFLISLLMIKCAPTPRWKWIHRFSALALITALAITNSRATIIGLAGSLAMSFFITHQMGIIGVLLLLMVGTMAMAMMLNPDLLAGVLGVFAELFSRSGSVQELTSLTGRSSIWDACFLLIKEKPFAGYGLGSVRVELPKVFYDQWGNSAATAHNFLLESMISVGLIGTLPLVVMLVMMTAGLWRYVGSGAKAYGLDLQERAMALCAFQILCMFWIQSMVERSFSGMASPTTVSLGLCITTCVYLLLNKPQPLRHSQPGYTFARPARST
ncbi:MAG: O-antigen ligase family protein [Aquabacterium sp.]|jgi:O-antigen ligase|uniref:O-antigen ligase family protein n=1 Tax=Aquabacterium sp. TaxID=1872578 RepID=UPI003BB19702